MGNIEEQIEKEEGKNITKEIFSYPVRDIDYIIVVYNDGNREKFENDSLLCNVILECNRTNSSFYIKIRLEDNIIRDNIISINNIFKIIINYNR